MADGFTVTFKTSSDGKFDVENILPTNTVLQVKEAVQTSTQIPVTEQRLIYRGRILKDAETVESHNIVSGHTIHLVRSGAKPPTSAAATTPAVQPVAETTAAPGLPAGGLPGGFMNSPAFRNMMNPENMQAMMANPQMQEMMMSVMAEPEMLQSMISENPMLRQLSESNPGLRMMLQNPSLMSSMMTPELLSQAANIQQMMGSQGYEETLGRLVNDPALAANVRRSMEQTGGPNFESMMTQMMGGANNTAAAAAAPVTAAAVQETMGVQLRQLEDMGFIDRDANVMALQRMGGDVNAAISWLLDAGHGS